MLVRRVGDTVELIVPQTLRRRLFDASHCDPLQPITVLNA